MYHSQVPFKSVAVFDDDDGQTDATCWCNIVVRNIVAHNMLRRFGHHVAQRCFRLGNHAQDVATRCMLHPFGQDFMCAVCE